MLESNVTINSGKNGVCKVSQERETATILFTVHWPGPYNIDKIYEFPYYLTSLDTEFPERGS